jgi:histone acetyltransferase (RNA polymerase elongator complex component)
MKAMMIIPVFISHMGCGNACVFCNQRHINGNAVVPTVEAIKRQVEDYTASGAAETVGIAFYGGSFTGIDTALQLAYLSLAQQYKQAGLIQHIRLSTRPDYIDETVIARLKAYGVDLVELGVQSFDDAVLHAANRGHDSRAIYRAVELLKNHGMAYGIQLMYGLPGDNRERFFFSVRETIRLKPATVRLYPTLVLKDTMLAEAYRKGFYMAPSLEDAVADSAEAYAMLMRAQMQVIRVGLQATDLIDFEGAVLAGPYHPAFKSLVLDHLVYGKLSQFAASMPTACENIESRAAEKTWKVDVHPSLVSHIRGHRQQNIKRLSERFGIDKIRIEADGRYGKSEIAIAYQGVVKTYGLYDEEVTICT